jgi:glycosyltransferase involved in cell wall biosynthesis
LALSWGVKPENLRVIHNSIDLDQFKAKSDFPKEYDFVTLCRLVRWKKVDEVIKAVSQSSSSLLVIGDGPERKKLEELASNYPSRINFVGNLQKNEIPAALSSARFFVLNSDFEATSYALMEAMALGLVPISRDDTGSAEIIEHLVDGILCGGETNYSLSQAVQDLVEGRLNSDILSTMARKKIEKNFNSRINYQEIADCCE